MVVRQKSIADPDVHVARVNPLLARLHRFRRHLPLLGEDRAQFTFNFNRQSGVRLQSTLELLNFQPDVICLHWTSGLLTTADIRRVHEHYRCPIFHIVLDQEPVTGGCHYSFGCQGYMQKCGRCPLLPRSSDRDASRRGWERKRRHLADLPITLVAPTSWAEDRVRDSSLFKTFSVARIPLPIDVGVFRSGDSTVARNKLGLPLDRPIVFFGSSYLHEPRKGMAYLREALGILAQTNGRDSKQSPAGAAPLLLVAGHNPHEVVRDLPFEHRWLGHLDDERELAAAYQAADVFVCPSVEDAGPMMIPEAMLCGTPVVAFNTGGAPDLIEHGRTGVLADLKRADALAAGIASMLRKIRTPDCATVRQQVADKALSLHEPNSRR